MKLSEAMEIMKTIDIANKPFAILFENTSIDTINKGKVGQLLEILLGLSNSSKLTDFEDGELKTNKSRENGLPLETMFITQVNSQVDDLLGGIKFENSRLYQKIRRMIYLPVVKKGKPTEWYFKPPIYVDLTSENKLYAELEKDFYSIIEQMKEHIEHRGGLHTSSGTYIQIRTKDSKPYTPIYSKMYGKFISNKNFAFYFKKEFMIDLLKQSPDYPDIY